MQTTTDPTTTLEIPLYPRAQGPGESFEKELLHERVYTDGFRAGRAGAAKRSLDRTVAGRPLFSSELLRELWELGRSDGARRLAVHRSQLAGRFRP